MITKEQLIEQIRAVPIAGKTYEEYVEALAEKLTEVNTNHDHIRFMDSDELASFFKDVAHMGGGFITIADGYICRKCKREHDGKCPVNLDENPCLYEADDAQTIKYWLEGEVEE